MNALVDAQLLTSHNQIMIEKPFGTDEKSARTLNTLLLSHVDEKNIYRVDHYLGKQALIDFKKHRMSDKALEKALRGSHVECIQVRLYESKGVGDRGAFYDNVGVLRDVGQNHLLQMAAAVLMDVYTTGTSSSRIARLRRARAQAIASLSVLKKKTLFRGQYKGYLQELGVRSNSKTETCMQVASRLSTPRWRGTGIILSSGKAMAESESDIRIVFRTPVILSSGIISRMTVSLTELEHCRGAYEHIFLAAFRRDMSFFCSIDEVIGGWKFVKSVALQWEKNKTPLLYYPPGSSGVLKIKE